MREVDPEEHLRSAFKNMTAVDKLPAEMRALIHEFGLVIVREMWNDGHRSAAKLRPELEAWRERQQEKWLSEVPYPQRRPSAALRHE